MKRTLCMRFLLLGFCLIMVSGCGRIVNWAEGNFYQGKEVPEFNSPQAYIKSIKVYDQFTTKGSFDVLWLSDDVKTAYSNANAAKFGKSEELRKAFLRRQLEENRHYVTFYVLTTLSGILGDSSSIWGLFLEVDGVTQQPAEINLADLSPEYRAFFGKKFNRFKTAYEVKFGMTTNDGAPLITSTTSEMTLHFRSLFKQAALTWALPQQTAATMELIKELPA